MGDASFRDQIHAYDRWKDGLIQAIENYQLWLDRHEMGDPDDELRIYHTLEALRNDRLTIAFVAEFSRGKSELINAIFFADYSRRLLPCSPGRTTMCPTELLHDNEHDGAYLRLLPIETRLEQTTLAEFRHEPRAWTTIDLDTGNPDQLEKALRELVKTKQVPLETARSLGLYQDETPEDETAEEATSGEQDAAPEPPASVEVPLWRHAILSFPHPLLKQGLAVLDTPGLNALGNEPELTINMLPSAQVVLFILAADTGVTRTDLDVWERYINNTKESRRPAVAVVLNKIDTLWDDLSTPEDVDAEISAQAGITSQLLSVPEELVFPVSAQKGLVARIKGDEALLEKSRLPQIEDFLADDIVPTRQRILFDSVRQNIGHLVENSRHTSESRLGQVRAQLTELSTLQNKNDDAIGKLMQRTRLEQQRYLKGVQGFESSRQILTRQSYAILDALDLTDLDHQLHCAQQEMVGRWTTPGLRSTMANLLEQLHTTMKEALQQTQQTTQLVEAIYRKFQDEHQLAAVVPAPLNVVQFGMELEVMNEEAEAFRRSLSAAMREQGFVIQKFFNSAVSRTRDIFMTAREEVENWTRTALNPLQQEIHTRKEEMERRLQNLKRIGESRDSLASRIEELETAANELDAQLQELAGIRQAIAGEPAGASSAGEPDDIPNAKAAP